MVEVTDIKEMNAADLEDCKDVMVKRGVEAAKMMISIGSSASSREAFARYIQTDHRTLQQDGMRAMLRAIELLAVNGSDARNSSAVEAAERIKDAFDGNFPGLPRI